MNYENLSNTATPGALKNVRDAERTVIRNKTIVPHAVRA